MTGETDLTTLLAKLTPRLSPVVYAFGTVADHTAIPATLSAIGTFRETEGLTIIAPAEHFTGTGIVHSPDWAMLTLEVHSSLQAVGMMAAIAQALAKAGISVNTVAGYYHDHIFVQWNRRHEAMQILTGLANVT